MEMQKIRTTLFRLLIIILLAGMAQDALAQRTDLRSRQRSDQKLSARTTLKKDKIVKRSDKQMIRKDRVSRSVRTNAIYSKKENRVKNYRDSGKVRKDRASKSVRSKGIYSKKENHINHYRDSRQEHKLYKRDRKHDYKHRGKNPQHPPQKIWHGRHYRKPAWVDYHRPGYRYPRIGMHVSVLPHGYFSFRIGNFRFYSYRGVYYCYDPALRVYVVVNKPRIEFSYTSVTWDRITLVDGSTIEGIYRYTDNDIVIFEVGDALLEIPISEIKLLSLS